MLSVWNPPDPSVDQQFCIDEKINTFRGQGNEDKPQSPKTKYGFQNQYARVIYRVIYRSEILYGAGKNIILGVKNVKISHQSPKTEFGLQNQYSRVIYPSIGNFICRLTFFIFEGPA
jgi:hypothetical protein